jgi:hypothetical protein
MRSGLRRNSSNMVIFMNERGISPQGKAPMAAKKINP